MRLYHYISIIFWVVLITLIWLYKVGEGEWWMILLWAVLYIVIVVTGVVRIQWDFFLRSYNYSLKNKEVALTFDDGPAAETAAILDILKEKLVPAAFFCIGKNIDAQPELVLRMYKEGHVIGNHSYRHSFNFDWKSAKGMVAEMEQTNTAIAKQTGVEPLLFRPPYGVTNPNVARAVMRTGMSSIGWNIRSYDTVAKDKARLLNKILSKLKGGDIILLHDSMPITREILTELIDRAREKGFTFTRIDQLLDIKAYA